MTNMRSALPLTELTELFMLSWNMTTQSISWPEYFITLIARNGNILQMICFNVSHNVSGTSFLSTLYKFSHELVSSHFEPCFDLSPSSIWQFFHPVVANLEKRMCVCCKTWAFSSLEQFNLTPIWAPGFICFPCKPIWASGFPCKTLSFNVLSSSSQHCPSHTFQL